MAQRPVFIPTGKPVKPVDTIMIEFKWLPGMALSRYQENIRTLHREIQSQNHIDNVLEISRKSENILGQQLSAFNLYFDPSFICEDATSRQLSVESAFQGSKITPEGGPYPDLFQVPSSVARRDPRVAGKEVIGFEFFSIKISAEPATLFYDWLYIRALAQNRELALSLMEYNAFTDIAFNPQKSINCQANSAALFVSLKKQGLSEEQTGDRSILSAYYNDDYYLSKSQREQISSQQYKTNQGLLFN